MISRNFDMLLPTDISFDNHLLHDTSSDDLIVDEYEDLL